MRQLLPTPIDDISIESAYLSTDDRPWLRLSMVLSVDGSATDEQGWTTTLAGDPDARMLRALRSLADAVIVGAGTVRTGRLGPIRTPRHASTSRGSGTTGADRAEPARLVVVSGTLDLDWSLPLFTKSARTPIVVTTAAAAAGDLPAAIRHELVTAGADRLDLSGAIEQLRDRGYPMLLCEGGPALATSMLEGGLVDELCLTQAPLIMAPGRLRGLAAGTGRLPLVLTHVGEDDGVLFLRYRPAVALGR